MLIDLENPIGLKHGLAQAIPLLRRFRTKKELFSSDLWLQHGPEIERAAGGIEYWVNPALQQSPSRPFIRAISWNIERGKRYTSVLDGLRHESIRMADIIILNEVDIGMARSGQRNIARLAAERLGMHYVFGNHYLCLDRGNPRDTLVLGKDGAVISEKDGIQDEENQLGLHGNAILSRHPILRAANIPLFETKDKFRSRSDKRFGVKKALRADILTPKGEMAVAAVHLDSVASPLNRSRQLGDLLAHLDETAACMPVLIGGDWNTSTYDLQSPWKLFLNLAAKFLRGGFPHAVPEYMRPYRIYDKPVFDVVERHGFNWRDFNNLNHSTTMYDVEDPESANIVREQVGMIGVKLLRWRLQAWQGKAPLKVDWFAGRNCRPAGPGNGALAPMSLERFRPGGRKASDHDPILADISW